MNQKHTARVLLLAFALFTGCKMTSPERTVPSSSPSPSSSTARAHSSSTEAHNTIDTADQSAQLIITFGEHRIGDTIVEASQSERKLTVKHLSRKDQLLGGKSTSYSAMSTPPDEWPLHDGWFAYAHENGTYVWLYNGKDKMLVVERKENPARNETNTYGPHNAPIPIPSVVLKHIKEPFRSKLQN